MSRPGRADPARQNLYAYFAQAIGMVSLGISNFAIPWFAGREAYGRLAIVQASVFASVGLFGGAAAQFLVGRGDPQGLGCRLRFVARTIAIVWLVYCFVAMSGLGLSGFSFAEKISAILLAAALPVGTLAYGAFVVTNRAERLVPATILNGLALSALPVVGFLVTREPAGLIAGYCAAFIASGVLVLWLARPVFRDLAPPCSAGAASSREFAALVLVNLSGSFFVWIALWLTSAYASPSDVAVDRVLLSVASATIAVMPLSRFVAQNLAADQAQLARILRSAYAALGIAGVGIPAVLPEVLGAFRVPPDQRFPGAMLVGWMLTPHFACQVLVSKLVGVGRATQVAVASACSAIAASGLVLVLAKLNAPFAALWGTLAQAGVFLVVAVASAHSDSIGVLRLAAGPGFVVGLSLAATTIWPEHSPASFAVGAILIGLHWRGASGAPRRVT